MEMNWVGYKLKKDDDFMDELRDLLKEHPQTDLNGASVDAERLLGKVLLFVNVASECGHTPQYQDLVGLHQNYAEKGLVVVGVPCNQFAGQEPGSPEEIGRFCSTQYGVEFPLLEKQDVNGQGRSILYRWLVNSSAGGGQDIEWNFAKFLVGRSGEVVAQFQPAISPSDSAIITAIQNEL